MNYKHSSGIIIGNVENKHDTVNPIKRALMTGFLNAFDDLTAATNACVIHEIGCGEGHLSKRLADKGCIVRASDFSSEIIETARSANHHENIQYVQRSIYSLQTTEDDAPLVICCEVLEHLREPTQALEILANLKAEWYLFSVPREPIWRFFNIARLKYLRDFGNTPGHLQHWNKRTFVKMIERYFLPIEIRSPLPWTMILCRQKLP